MNLMLWVHNSGDEKEGRRVKTGVKMGSGESEAYDIF